MELARVVAKNAATPEALLTELSHPADAATRRALVANPATPLNVLQEISGQFPEELLGNPALDVFLLENQTFFRDLPITLLRAVVKRENCSAGVLAQAATVDDEVVLLGVFQNEAAPVATLQALQNAALATVREAAVEREFPPPASTELERRNHREWIARLIARYRHGKPVSPALLQ